VILNVGIDEGDGPPLILLHGWPQHSGMWRSVVDALSGDFRCIALDLRGLGASRAPEGGYDKPTLAEDVIDTMDSLEIDRARFIGHDWGALVSSIIARDHPERVERVLMLSVPPPWDLTLDPRRLVSLAHMPFMASPLGAKLGPSFGKRLMTMQSISEDAAEDYVAPLRSPERARAAHLYYRTFLLHELPAALRERPEMPKVPIRVVGGERDPVCRWSRGLEKVPGVGHFLVDERPDVVVEHAKSFL